MNRHRFHRRAFSCFMAPIAWMSSVVVSWNRLVAGERPDWIAGGRRGMVACDSPHASQAGLSVLQTGGTAVDAATAVSFALAVTRPYSTGLGGGGFALIRLANGEVHVLDCRESAPAAAAPDMYAQAPPDASRYGYLAVGVPGLLAGRVEALKKFGTWPLKRTLQPAIRLARDGYPIDEHFVSRSREALQAYEAHPELTKTCRYVYEVDLNEGRLYSPGAVLKQPRLADFLQHLADEGPDFFYRGAFAETLEKDMIRHGGVLRASDLANYRVKWRRPLVGTYRGYQILTMPPPSSGGIAILETLNQLETFSLEEIARRRERNGPALLIEAMKHAFADRARWLGDDDFTDVPANYLTSKTYARQLAERIRQADDHPLSLEDYGVAQLPDDAGTSHFCVVDGAGNVVVSTETINTSFGSLAAAEEWGVILNNEMDDFSTRPDQPNAYGLVQSARNKIEPGKRPLSSMSPTLVLKNGEPYLMLGASGGPRIISSVLNVMLPVLDDGASLEEAIAAARVHHQWRPDEVYFDRTPPDDLSETLRRRGYRLADKRVEGVVQAILKTEEGWVGASDPRKGGRPAGY